MRVRQAAWAAAHTQALTDARPAMPEGITDRPADVWEPLLAVADVAGGERPKRARAAAARLNAERQAADPSLGVKLLTDIRRVFGDKRADKLTSVALVALEESPWGALPRTGRPLDVIGLAARVKPFDVKPQVLRFGANIGRGYELPWFADAFARYLPLVPVPDTTDAEATADESTATPASVPPHDTPVTPATPVTTREALLP